MSGAKVINLVVEDILSEAVAKKIIQETDSSWALGATYGKQGNKYIIKKMRAFNNASRYTPYLIVIDLDSKVCAPSYLKELVGFQKNPCFIVRIAVREIEAWLLADREGFSDFIGVSLNKLPMDSETIKNPKKVVINLASNSRKKYMRTDISPKFNSTAQKGPNYNSKLSEFVREHWSLSRACKNSGSLKGSIQKIKTFFENYAITQCT